MSLTLPWLTVFNVSIKIKFNIVKNNTLNVISYIPSKNSARILLQFYDILYNWFIIFKDLLAFVAAADVAA